MPAVASHRLFELSILLTASIAMLWFCLCASGTYIVNDLLDLMPIENIHESAIARSLPAKFPSRREYWLPRS